MTGTLDSDIPRASPGTSGPSCSRISAPSRNIRSIFLRAGAFGLRPFTIAFGRADTPPLARPFALLCAEWVIAGLAIPHSPSLSWYQSTDPP
jgi:hypothetical protein